jgi:hypothetical protein
MMAQSIQGVSNQRYRRLFKGKREKLVAQYEEERSDAGKLARLVRDLEQAVTMADKEGFFFNKCPLCGTGQSSGTTPHHRDCAWPHLVAALREEGRR